MTKRILLAAVAAVVVAGGTGRAADPAAKTETPAAVLVARGLDLQKDKKYEAAADFYRAAVKVAPKDTEAMYRLAWVCNEVKDYDEAIVWAKAVTRINAKDGDAWRELGYAQMLTGDHGGAVKSLTAAVKLNPKDVPAHDYMVRAYKALGDDDEAAAWQAKADALKDAQKQPGKVAKPTKPTELD
jgi:tetratricopeptide (TPR) repeat protein